MAETWVSMPELELLIGQEMAGILCRLRGGVAFYVPTKARTDHFIAKTVGYKAMELLCSEYAGLYITVPNGRKQASLKAAIIERLEKGESNACIALELGVTERYVRMVATFIPDVKQLTLPLT